jgi:hypothetical protein
MIEVSVEELRQVRAYARNLAEEGNLPKAVQELVENDLPGDASQLLDEHVVRLTRLAQFDDVILATEALPRPDRSLLTRVAYLDAMQHQRGVALGDLEELLEAATAAGRMDLRWWVAATLVEHLYFEGDGFAYVLAATCLAEMPDDPLPSALVLQARGRLRRNAALLHVIRGPRGEATAWAEADRAIGDFVRATWFAEHWVTVSAFHSFLISFSWSAPQDVMHAITEARDQLMAMGACQVHFARFTLIMAHFVNGDVTGLRAELAELRRMNLSGKTSALQAFAEHLDALVELTFSGGDDAIARLEQATEKLRRVHPAMTGLMLSRTAQALIDVGRTAEAAEWAGRLTATQPLRPYEAYEREVVACRVAMLRGERDVADRLRTALQGLSESAYPRVMGGQALRSAMTASRVGLHDLARELRTLSDKYLPPPAERNGWERFWARSFDGPDAAQGRPVTRTLRVLAPSVEVSVDGEPRHLAPNVARLLVTLAALGRAVGAEELAELLWADADPARARGRLKSALHRLRQALSLEADELVVREGDVVRLVPDPRWSIDLFEFERRSNGGPQDRLAALGMVGGLLCVAQFPYDDVLAQARAVLEARWAALVADLLRLGLIDEHEGRRRAQQLGVPDPWGE